MRTHENPWSQCLNLSTCFSKKHHDNWAKVFLFVNFMEFWFSVKYLCSHYDTLGYWIGYLDL